MKKKLNRNVNKNEIAKFVAQVMREKKLSTYEVQRRSGNRINQSYISRIRNGENQNPSPEKLKALARGLEVTEEEIFSIIRGGLPSSQNIANEQFQNLSQIFENLPASKKLHAQILIDMIEREFKVLANKE